jgi:hypothetical protein
MADKRQSEHEAQPKKDDPAETPARKRNVLAEIFRRALLRRTSTSR